MPKDHGIGAEVKRREDIRFLTGAGNYTDDINIHGQAYMVVVRSNSAHARIKSVGVSAAEGMPGVLAIFNHIVSVAVDHKWLYWWYPIGLLFGAVVTGLLKGQIEGVTPAKGNTDRQSAVVKATPNSSCSMTLSRRVRAMFAAFATTALLRSSKTNRSPTLTVPRMSCRTRSCYSASPAKPPIDPITP